MSCLGFPNRLLRTRFHPQRLGHFAPLSFPAYGGKIQATRFTGDRWLRKYIYDPMSCKDTCGGMNLIFDISRLKTFLTSPLFFRIAGFGLWDRRFNKMSLTGRRNFLYYSSLLWNNFIYAKANLNHIDLHFQLLLICNRRIRLCRLRIQMLLQIADDGAWTGLTDFGCF